MEVTREILDLEDVKLLVDSFYDKVREDDKLAPVFEERIQGNWRPHLQKMYKFWQTVLLGEHTYFGSPFPHHAMLPVDHSHFATWLELFNQTIEELFSGEKAEEARWRALKMAELFEHKITYLRGTKET
ncbi:group III truncated hemoglobin [Dyadobacter diqingensis]|uniref:group III truncated hemoglobin n=1 Tax=Dyadobacter diqingensis TaxID=2938121 RepID=UPI0020C4A6AA|nr:group III truncated hemoglobin [Dyadobacter diqingensis]